MSEISNQNKNKIPLQKEGKLLHPKNDQPLHQQLAVQNQLALNSLASILSSIEFHQQLKNITDPDNPNYLPPENQEPALVRSGNPNKPKQPDLEIGLELPDGSDNDNNAYIRANTIFSDNQDKKATSKSSGGANNEEGDYQPPKAIFSNFNEREGVGNLNDKDKDNYRDNERTGYKENTRVENTAFGFEAVVAEYERQEREALEKENQDKWEREQEIEKDRQNSDNDRENQNNRESPSNSDRSYRSVEQERLERNQLNETVKSKVRSRSEELRAKFQAERAEKVGKLTQAENKNVEERVQKEAVNTNKSTTQEAERIKQERNQEKEAVNEKTTEPKEKTEKAEAEKTSTSEQVQNKENEQTQDKEALDKLQSELLENVLEAKGLKESELYASDKEKLIKEALESQKVENLAELNTKITSGETTLETINETFKTHSEIESIKEAGNLTPQEKVKSLVEYLKTDNLPQGVDVEKILLQSGYSEFWLPYKSESELKTLFESIQAKATTAAEEQSSVNKSSDYLTTTLNNLSPSEANRLALQLKYANKEGLLMYVETYKNIKDISKLKELVEKVKGEVGESATSTDNTGKDSSTNEAEKQAQIDAKLQELIKEKGLDYDNLYQSEKQQLQEEARRAVENSQEYERDRVEEIFEQVIDKLHKAGSLENVTNILQSINLENLNSEQLAKVQEVVENDIAQTFMDSVMLHNYIENIEVSKSDSYRIDFYKHYFKEEVERFVQEKIGKGEKINEKIIKNKVKELLEKKADFFRKRGVDIRDGSQLEANHQAMKGLADKFPYQMKWALAEAGVSSINDQRIMDIMTPEINKKHRDYINRRAKELEASKPPNEITANDILQILADTQHNPDLPPLDRPVDYIDFRKYLK